MSKGSQHMDDDLLVKFISGQCSGEEISRVNQWLNEVPENQSYFDNLETTWILSESGKINYQFNSSIAWEKISKRIHDSGTEEEKPIIELNQRRGNRNSIYYFTSIAAALLMGVFIYQAVFQEKILSTTLLVSTDGLMVKTLKDGSEISLNNESELSFLEDFNTETRTVELKGEAFFDIKPDKGKPFIIKSEIGNIRVLGTSFTVKAREDSDFEVQVETGLVQLFTTSNDSKDTNSLFLGPGTKGIINSQTGDIYPLTNNDPAALFWLNKQLNFNKTPLLEVFSILEEYYPVQIEFDEIALSNCKLTAKFKEDSLETILEVIGATFNFEIEKNNPNQIKVLANDPDCPVENI